MKKSVAIISVLFGSVLLASLARAQVVESPNAPGATGRIEGAISTAGKYQDYVYGVVKKIRKDELVVDKTVYGDNQVFKLEHKTKFIRNGKSGSLADLKVGDMVWIDAKMKKKSDEKIAKKVITGVAATGAVR
jgi:hypothetical protein